jgi:membrane protein
VVTLLRTLWHRYLDENVSTLAAGIGLFALLALPAALVLIASIYGLVSTRADVWDHIHWIGRFLPRDVTTLLQGVMTHIATRSASSLGIALVASFLFALLGVESAVSATMGALNAINHLREHRTWVRRHVTSLGLTIGAIVLGITGVVALVALPSIVRIAHLRGDTWDVIDLVRWPAIFVLGSLYLSFVYRLAPADGVVRWRGALVGAATGSALWLLASLGLSFWVSTMTDYAAMYGAAGSMLVVLLWFYLGALAVLLGGIVAAETGGRPTTVV